MINNPASFRDPCGYVYDDGSFIYRTVEQSYSQDWHKLRETGLLTELVNHGLIPFEILAEWPMKLGKDHLAVLWVDKLPFISYPYEWSFSQLKDAALLTLDLHIAALDKGMILKDASAYNVQFYKGKPVFIDHLSFEIWKEGQPWQAYGQFCQHFLAPLALMAKKDIHLGKLSQIYIDGVPLELASQLLPGMTKFSPSIGMHIHMHASMRQKHADARISAEKSKKAHSSMRKMLDVAQSLKDAVNSLEISGKNTEWGNYYSDTNYTPETRKRKEEFVYEMAAANIGGVAVDIGANTGEFSRLLAPYFELVLAPDGDHTAVDRHWRKERTNNVLPLLLDLAAPSPGIGWANMERPSFTDRCKANFLTALAVCHHLRFTFGIPFNQQAKWFKQLLAPNGKILVEFVPREDSQVKRLLAARDDIFMDYTLENFVKAFQEQGLDVMESTELKSGGRILFLFGK